jgi:hypothetical protein
VTRATYEPGFHPEMPLEHYYADPAPGPCGAHLTAMFMGNEWLPEVALVWKETTHWGTVMCRALVDAYCPKMKHGVDVKASTDASTSHAKRRMQQGGYDVQNAWYSRGLCATTGTHPAELQFSTVFAESKQPFCSQGFQLSGAWQSSAWNECELALRLFSQCQKEGRWPGYSRNPQLLVPPSWLITQRLEAELGGEAMDLNDEPPSDFGGDND